jgi:hypothetical protein
MENNPTLSGPGGGFTAPRDSAAGEQPRAPTLSRMTERAPLEQQVPDSRRACPATFGRRGSEARAYGETGERSQIRTRGGLPPRVGGLPATLGGLPPSFRVVVPDCRLVAPSLGRVAPEFPPTVGGLPPTSRELPPTVGGLPPQSVGVGVVVVNVLGHALAVFPGTAGFAGAVVDKGDLNFVGLPPTFWGSPPDFAGLPLTCGGLPPTFRGVPPTLGGLPPSLRGLPPTVWGWPAAMGGLPPSFRAVVPDFRKVAPVLGGVAPDCLPTLGGGSTDRWGVPRPQGGEGEVLGPALSVALANARSGGIAGKEVKADERCGVASGAAGVVGDARAAGAEEAARHACSVVMAGAAGDAGAAGYQV